LCKPNKKETNISRIEYELMILTYSW